MSRTFELARLRIGSFVAAAPIVLVVTILALPARGQQPATFSGLKEVNPPAEPEPVVQAIVGATLVDGRGGQPVKDSVVVLRGSRIDAAGLRDRVAIPRGARIVNVAGMTLVPGLCDSHLHVGPAPKEAQTIPPLFLSHGVTSARDPGIPFENYDSVRDWKDPLPRRFLTGNHFDVQPFAYPKDAILVESPQAARETVDRFVARGASGIKVYFRLPLASIEATCDQARRHGIPVTAHLELVRADDAIKAGVRGIEHITSFGTTLADLAAAESFREAVRRENDARNDGRYRLWADLDFDDRNRVEPLVKLIVERGVFVSPTLAVFERRDGDKNIGLHHVRGFEKMLRFVGICHKAGASVVVGSHTSGPHAEYGWAYQREMELLVEAGLSPLEAITAATWNNARFFGCAERLGSIEPGKLADLVLVAGAPHENIKAMYDIRHVMLNGTWVGAAPKTAAE